MLTTTNYYSHLIKIMRERAWSCRLSTRAEGRDA